MSSSVVRELKRYKRQLDFHSSLIGRVLSSLKRPVKIRKRKDTSFLAGTSESKRIGVTSTQESRRSVAQEDLGIAEVCDSL